MISHDRLIEKISALPPRRLEEVADFVDFLADRDAGDRRAERAKRIAQFAREFGGTAMDLDPELEGAGIETLVAIDEDPQT